MKKSALTFQTKRDERTLKTVPVILPNPGASFVVEFIAIGQTLYARLDGQVASVQLTAQDDPDLRGESLMSIPRSSGMPTRKRHSPKF